MDGLQFNVIFNSISVTSRRLEAVCNGTLSTVERGSNSVPAETEDRSCDPGLVVQRVIYDTIAAPAFMYTKRMKERTMNFCTYIMEPY